MHLFEFYGLIFSLTSLFLTISQSHEVVDLVHRSLILTVATDGKEGANEVDIGDHAEVSLSSFSDSRVDNLGISQVEPVLFHNIFAELFAVLDKEDIRFVLAVGAVIVIVDALSVNLDIITVGKVNDNFVLIELISNLEGFNSNWVVVGSFLEGKSISESDEGVDGESGFSLSPGGDGKESTDKISVDGEELIATISSVDSTEVKEAGFGEVVPVLFFDGMINEVIDVVVVPFTLDRQDFHFVTTFSLQHP